MVDMIATASGRGHVDKELFATISPQFVHDVGNRLRQRNSFFFVLIGAKGLGGWGGGTVTTNLFGNYHIVLLFFSFLNKNMKS